MKARGDLISLEMCGWARTPIRIDLRISLVSEYDHAVSSSTDSPRHETERRIGDFVGLSMFPSNWQHRLALVSAVFLVAEAGAFVDLIF